MATKFEFSKEQRKQIDEYARHFSVAKAKLEEALEEINEEIRSAYTRANEEIGAYNAILTDVRTFFENLHGELESEYEEKSDGWKQSDRGEAIKAWLDEIEGLELTNLEPACEDDEVPQIEMPTLDHCDDLTNLEAEPAS